MILSILKKFSNINSKSRQKQFSESVLVFLTNDTKTYKICVFIHYSYFLVFSGGVKEKIGVEKKEIIPFQVF
jgi:hypothetical protein